VLAATVVAGAFSRRELGASPRARHKADSGTGEVQLGWRTPNIREREGHSPSPVVYQAMSVMIDQRTECEDLADSLTRPEFGSCPCESQVVRDALHGCFLDRNYRSSEGAP
jgi:hypothetical protein